MLLPLRRQASERSKQCSRIRVFKKTCNSSSSFSHTVGETRNWESIHMWTYRICIYIKLIYIYCNYTVYSTVIGNKSSFARSPWRLIEKTTRARISTSAALWTRASDFFTEAPREIPLSRVSPWVWENINYEIFILKKKQVQINNGKYSFGDRILSKVKTSILFWKIIKNSNKTLKQMSQLFWFNYIFYV